MDVDDAIENDVEIKSLSVTIGAKICCANVKSFLFFLKFFFVELNNADKQHDRVLFCLRFFKRFFFLIYPLDLVRLI
jgi:hypothetical protein